MPTFQDLPNSPLLLVNENARPITGRPLSPDSVCVSFSSFHPSEKLSIGIRFQSSEKASPSGSRGLKTRNLKRFSLLRHFSDLTKCAYNC